MTNSNALLDVLDRYRLPESEFGFTSDMKNLLLDIMFKNPEQIARALIARCTDLVIVPRGELSEIAEQHQHSRMHGAWVDCNKATSDRAAADGLEVRIVYLPATPEK